MRYNSNISIFLSVIYHIYDAEKGFFYIVGIMKALFIGISFISRMALKVHQSLDKHWHYLKKIL